MDPRWSQPPPAWQPPYPAWPAPGPSGLLKASGVLLLVGSILSAVGAGFLLLMAAFMGVVFGNLSESGGPGMVPGFIAAFYAIIAVVAAAGAVCGFIAWRKVPGDLDSAFVWGLVGAILQGVNVVTLLGAIFAKTCPEAEAAAARRRQGWAQPPQSP